MSFISTQDLADLNRRPGGWCVSLYMNTVKAGDQIKQNRIRYKNLLNQVEKKLDAAGMEPAHRDAYLSEAQVLEKDGVFWTQQDHGLAVFLSKNGLRMYKLPVEVEDIAVVNERFYLKPLIQLLHGGGEFYVLALSLGETRLFKGTEKSIEEMSLGENTPKSLEEATKYDVFDQTHGQWHSETSQPVGPNPGGEVAGHERYNASFGQGDRDTRKVQIRRFFQALERGVTDQLNEGNAPLVLAGIDYLLPIYKEVNRYNGLVNKSITINPEAIQERELHEEAWKIVEPMFQVSMQKDVQRFLQFEGWKDRRATTDMEEVIKAAPFGRVEVLFVDKNAKKWGVFDTKNNQVEFEKQQRPENEDLLDFAAIQTLLNGGVVYAVEPEDVPGGGSPVSAILRY